MLNEVIPNYAKKDEFTLVLEKNDLMVLYSESSIDMDAAVIQELNTNWKAKGGK
jgi:Outer membrane protein (OmpH-like).